MANSILLSTITDRGIQGAEPRLSDDLEAEIAAEAFNRFGFTYNDVNYDDSNINSFPIIAPSTKVSDLKSQLSSTFNDTLIDSDATDANGDGNFKLVGIDNTNINKELGLDELSIKIRDGANNDITGETNATKTFCDLSISNPPPYKIEISNNLRLTTEYGDPRNKDYTDGTVETDKKQPSKQYPFSVVGACRAQPNMAYRNVPYAGPADMWDTSNGFKVQSVNDYSKNFPTTGSNNLYFMLNIVGVDAKTLKWGDATSVGGIGKVDVNGITVTMDNITATSVRVTLTGPYPLANQKSSNTPGKVDKPSLPATIELIGKDGNKEVVKYGFVIKQWFIHRDNIRGLSRDQALWCTSAGYLMPTVADFTNAIGSAGGDGGTIPNVPGPNTSTGNYFQRRIGGGLFSEWGGMENSYPGSGWLMWGYWTSDTTGVTGANQFVVDGYQGRVFGRSAASYTDRGVCLSQ